MKKVLYLGTDQAFTLDGYEVIHYPVILLIPKTIQDEKVQDCLKNLQLFTHCFITSKNAVEILFSLSLDVLEKLQKKCVSIGPATSMALRKKGIIPLWEASLSSQEGVIEEMKKYSWKDAYIFYPRSSLARPLLASYLIQEKISYEALDLYDTVFQTPYPIPSLEDIQEIIFTSPSTVEGFFRIFPNMSEGKKLRFQGAVTEDAFLRISKDRLIRDQSFLMT